jgi:hypothetical protein
LQFSLITHKSLGNPSSLPPLLFLSLFLLILYWRRPYLLFPSPSRFSGPAREHTAPAASGPSAGAQLAHRGHAGCGGLWRGRARGGVAPARKLGRRRSARLGSGRGSRASSGQAAGGRAAAAGARARQADARRTAWQAGRRRRPSAGWWAQARRGRASAWRGSRRLRRVGASGSAGGAGGRCTAGAGAGLGGTHERAEQEQECV